MPVAGTAQSAPLSTSLPTRSARRAEDSAPLSVAIETLTPSTVPKAGPVRITGSVTNRDEASWSRVNVYAFIDDTPMRSAAELADAVRLPATADVGDRITDTGYYDTIDTLAPGETAPFSVKVPRAALHVDEAGVYWFGVHALGEGPDGRLPGADGRARTFLPLVPTTRRQVDTALVVPLRRGASYAPDGSLEGVDGWTRALSREGRLRSLVDFGVSAGSRPLTWLLDPALPDAVHALTIGNPPRSLEPTVVPDSENPDESPSADVGATPAPSASPDEGTAEEDPGATAAADAGNAWLERLHEALDDSQILALPYGDLDVAAAAEHDRSLYARARQRSGSVLEPWGLEMSPAIAPPAGYLDGPGIVAADSGDTVLVTDRMFRDAPPPVTRTAGARLIPTSSGAMAGGPGPDARRSAVALRQRILSEAAVRLLAPGHSPLVVVFPQHWAPQATTGFFEGLDVDWLHLTSLEDATDHQGRDVSLDRLVYPRREARLELDAANFTSATSLIQAGETLQNVLSDNDSVATVVADEALSGTSYAARRHPDSARASADRSRAWIDDQLGSIGIEAPRAVTLSSASGRFAATLTNGLDQAVTVSIDALADPPLRISGPKTVDIGPEGRTTVLLNASTTKLGVHNVTLVVTDVDGTPLGSSDGIPIRSAQVSNVIWVILGTGVALLFGAIAVRLFRRVRAAARAAKEPSP